MVKSISPHVWAWQLNRHCRVNHVAHFTDSVLGCLWDSYLYYHYFVSKEILIGLFFGGIPRAAIDSMVPDNDDVISSAKIDGYDVDEQDKLLEINSYDLV